MRHGDFVAAYNMAKRDACAVISATLKRNPIATTAQTFGLVDAFILGRYFGLSDALAEVSQLPDKEALNDSAKRRAKKGAK